MFKLLHSAVRAVSQTTVLSSRICSNVTPIKYVNRPHVKLFSSITLHNPTLPKLLTDSRIQKMNNNISRNLIKFSMRKGKRKTVRPVLRRFYRLHWGIWIRTMCGRGKRLWRKSPPRKRRLRQHVFCNATQSRMLDKMVGSYWMKPKHYVDDPYEPYHIREDYYLSARKPRPYIPVDAESK